MACIRISKMPTIWAVGIGNLESTNQPFNLNSHNRSSVELNFHLINGGCVIAVPSLTA